MTNPTPTPVNDTAVPAKTLSDLQHDAVTLTGILEGIRSLENETEHFSNALTSLIEVAWERADCLADDLDRLDTGK
ncbi:MAG: hypothetical protein SWN98_04430 [Pseudomonadota bacterium]|jgi:hypothetical protein|nr:hypothetical protein JT55_10500 [Rhodovulum sp. NI22]MDY6858567.1 hypothetical protein [Pseudomonadota bacterium]